MRDRNYTAHPNLLPCPFCGGEAVIFDNRINQYDASYSVGCLKCGARIDGTDEEVSETIAKWNTRGSNKDYAMQIEAASKKIKGEADTEISKLKKDKILREQIAYQLFCRNARYLACKTWKECLACANKDYDDYYHNSNKSPEN